MSKDQLPPRVVPPPPSIKNITHLTIELGWADYLMNISEPYKSKNAKLETEITFRPVGHETWNIAYEGPNAWCVMQDLRPDHFYELRIRFKNCYGFGPYSEILVLRTKSEPLNGLQLHKVVSFGTEFDLIKFLENRDFPSEWNTFDKYDHTPLMAATFLNKKRFVEILLDYNFEPDAKNMNGKTALMIAANKGHNLIINLLLDKKADPNAKDNKGYSSLFYAVDGEQYSCIKDLILNGAVVNYQEPKMGQTPLIRLASCGNNGNVRVAHALLTNGANVDIQDWEGQTALIHTAYHNNMAPLAKLLLEKGADFRILTKTGFTAHQIAESLKNHNIREVIEKCMMRNPTRNNSYVMPPRWDIFKYCH